MSSTVVITATSVVTQSGNQVACELDGETVMMHVDSGEYFGCDEIGTRVWNLIEEPCAVADLCSKLAVQFEIDQAQCQDDVLPFLNELAEAELVDIAAAA